jgi:hypothetical protein
MADSTKDGMLTHLSALQSLRGTGAQDAEFSRRLQIVKGWQRARLARTYADLAVQPRYAPAVDFFLNDLYALKGFSKRDAEMIRIYPTLRKLLPKSTVETVGFAMELDVLSENLDQTLTRLLFEKDSAFSEARYIEAFRRCSKEVERMRQAEPVDQVGERLDAAVEKPLIYSTLKLLRKPAHLSGLEELKDFLEHGFSAFRQMHGAKRISCHHCEARKPNHQADCFRAPSAFFSVDSGLATSPGAVFVASARTSSRSRCTARSIGPFIALSKKPSVTSSFMS